MFFISFLKEFFQMIVLSHLSFDVVNHMLRKLYRLSIVSGGLQ